MRQRNINLQSNWLLYGKSLLAVESMASEGLPKTFYPASPDELGSLVADNEDMIRTGMEEMYDKNKANNPKGKILHPWLHTIKLASYEETFTDGLTAEAEALSHGLNNNSDDDYRREQIREIHHPYLGVIDETDFVWRVPGRMSGYNAVRDGLWLQIKHRRHSQEDELL